jgi:hypothetical protein
VWLRNVLFALLCLVGLTALAATLVPLRNTASDRGLRSPGDGDSAASNDALETVRRVDEAFRADWAKANLSPTPAADDLTIARRLTLGLLGTIPSLEEIRRWEAEPPSTRRELWLTSILNDRRCHDYLAERLARAFVGVHNEPFLIYRRRRFVTWLSDQLQANRPYDAIVRDLIADAGLWTDRPATNFITATVKPDEKQGPDEAALAARVSRAFLGVRLDCAECHDHPFQPWKQGDFQGLAAFFGQTRRNTFTGIADADGEYSFINQKTGQEQTVAPCVPFHGELLPAQGTRRQQLAAWVTNPANRAFGRAVVNRFWAELFGKPLVEPIDDLPSAADLPPVINLLADDFVEHGYDLRRLIQIIAKTEAFRLDSRGQAGGDEVTVEQEAAWAAFPITRLRPEQAIGGLVQSSSLSTIDYGSHILVRIGRAGAENDFIKRYGDLGEEEFSPQGGTIPQRLLMMNGERLQKSIEPNLVLNASARIAMLAPSDEKAVETAYLAALTRRPTNEETHYFVSQLADKTDSRSRGERLEDLYWCLLNSTEFSWNH